MPTFAGRCAWWLLLLLAACGLPDRSNPADPRIGGNEGDGFQLLAEVPENHRSEIADRIAEVRYSISAVDMPKPIEGTMDLIGTSARARISGLTAGAERIFSILAVDESGIPTFAAIDTQDVDAESTEAISLQMHRLFGIVEIVSLLPPEIIALEVQIGTGADTLLRQFEVDGPLTRRIVDTLAGLVAQAQQAGQLQTTLPAAKLGVLVYTYLMGITQSWLFAPDLFCLQDEKSFFIERLQRMMGQ